MRSDQSARLQDEFGSIDIYLFDQLLRGRFDARRRIIDAGCGSGRNLPYFLRNGFDVRAADADASAVQSVRRLGASLVPGFEAERVHHGALDALPWEGESADAVICSAVLHFSRDEAEFVSIVRELWRVLVPGGLFFARLASSIGIETHLPVTRGRVRLPDGSDRFVVDERMLLDVSAALGGHLADPIKTTNVQNMRCMTTWALEK
ncbi:MAG TPA: class I SAM-dependent methyltransferase [Vicinamibacterales bacterium]|jgi:SAM-dependent methyltransferase|nr:class I SAM-dependent methyltransferase [Vicinamibacterales bacterium]